MPRSVPAVLTCLAAITLAGLAFADDAKSPKKAPEASKPPAPSAPSNSPEVAPTDVCYELSKDSKAWPKEAQQLCIKTVGGATTARFQVALPGTPKVVATMNVNVTARARCLDCNQTTYTLDAPAGPLALTIVFDGKRPTGGAETGTVNIFGEKVSYRFQATK